MKTVRAIRFFDVVPLDDVLDRLAADAARPAVVGRLAALLLPSYLPAGKPPPEQLARAVAMVRQHPRAAEAFYRQAAAQAPLQLAVNFFVMLHHSLAVYVQRRGSEEARAAQASQAPPPKAKGKRRGGGGAPSLRLLSGGGGGAGGGGDSPGCRSCRRWWR